MTVIYQHFTYGSENFPFIYNDNEFKITCAAVPNEENGGVNYGFAICSLNDQFCKKTGRELALSRAEDIHHPYCIISSDDHVDLKQALQLFLTASILEDVLPEKLRYAVLRNISSGIF